MTKAQLNDIIDRERDREHPRKRSRPVARGVISVKSAAIAAAVMLMLAAGCAVASRLSVLIVVLSYFLWNLLYSLVLKRIVIVDVLAISVGFLLRIFAGGLAVGVEPSHWMLLVTFFLALFLGFSKRRSEIIVLAGNNEHRVVLESYGMTLLNALIVSSATLTIITYSLYAADGSTVERLGSVRLVYTVPLVVLGLFRYLYLTYQRRRGDDVVEAILKDPATLFDVAAWAALTLAILYGGWT